MSGPPGRKLLTIGVNKTQVLHSALFPKRRIEAKDDLHHLSHNEFSSRRILLLYGRNNSHDSRFHYAQWESDDRLLRLKPIHSNETRSPFDLANWCIEMNLDFL